MFQKKTKKQQKTKKLRIYTANSRKPAVIAMWLLFICGFAFAVYKDFTAIDTHTVHEKEIVERRVEDTSGVEAFVRNFAKTYYSWSGNKDSVAQRTDALTGYLTEDLQRLTADTVRSDIAVSSSVQDVQIWSVEQNGGENDFAVVFTVAQTISDGKKKDTVSSVYKTMVHKADNGDMVITQAPTITGKPAKSAYTSKAAEPDGTVSAAESEDITDFLTTFFTLYPTATEKSCLTTSAGIPCRRLSARTTRSAS
ncbi:MAG: conjugal transfer protein [Acutalibacteraceae bacterium]